MKGWVRWKGRLGAEQIGTSLFETEDLLKVRIPMWHSICRTINIYDFFLRTIFLSFIF